MTVFWRRRKEGDRAGSANHRPNRQHDDDLRRHRCRQQARPAQPRNLLRAIGQAGDESQRPFFAGGVMLHRRNDEVGIEPADPQSFRLSQQPLPRAIAQERPTKICLDDLSKDMNCRIFAAVRHANPRHRRHSAGAIVGISQLSQRDESTHRSRAERASNAPGLADVKRRRDRDTFRRWFAR
jgi:hypothetical protein